MITLYFNQLMIILTNQCSLVVYDLYSKSKLHYQLCNMCMKLHVKYHKDLECRLMITECCTRIMFWSKVSIFLKFLSISILPLVVHFATTYREVLLVLYIPGIDASSYPGYEIATVFHVVYFTFSGFGLSFFELQIIAIAFNTTCLGDILIFKMRKADGNKDSLRQELMGIIQLYTADYVNLVKTFSQSYQTLITCKYLTAVMNISFALFVIQLVSFILGGLYGYLYTNHLFPERLVCWVLNCFWNRL